MPNYNQSVFAHYKSGGYKSMNLFPCTLIDLYFIDVFDQFQFGRVFSHVLMQRDECVVFTIWKHEDRNLGLQSMKDIAKTNLVSWGKPIHLIKPKT